MFSFLTPALGLATIALIIPIAIHLWNKREHQRIRIGSLKWLIILESTKVSSFKLDERWLLLVRLLLLTSVVLVMMQPRLVRPVSPQQKQEKIWALVAPELFEDPTIVDEIAALNAQGIDTRYLVHSFTAIEQRQQPFSNPTAYWPVLETLNALENPPDSVMVYAQLNPSILGVYRPKLKIPIQWNVIPLENPTTYLMGVWNDEHRLKIVLGTADEKVTSAASYHGSFVALEQKIGLKLQGDTVVYRNQKMFIDTLIAKKVGVFYQKKYARDIDYIGVMLNAVAQYTGVAINLEEFSAMPEKIADFDLFIWYADIPLDSLLKRAVLPYVQLLNNPQSHTAVIANTGDTQSYLLYQRINMRENTKTKTSNFPSILLHMLFDDPNYRSLQQQYDQRFVDTKQIQLARPKNRPDLPQQSSIMKNNPLKTWLWLIILPLYFVERYFSLRSSY